MTPYYRKQVVEQLKIAKTRLAKNQLKWTYGKEVYICSDLRSKSTLTRNIVMDRLYPSTSVNYWLKQTLNVTSTFDEIQAYRHRWVDELIREFLV